MGNFTSTYCCHLTAKESNVTDILKKDGVRFWIDWSVSKELYLNCALSKVEAIFEFVKVHIY